MNKSHLLGTCLLITASFTAEATVVYSLNDVVFNDGGTATGTFTYDVGTNTYSNISIVTTAGSMFSGATYTNLFDDFPSGFPSGRFGLQVKDTASPISAGDSILRLSFESGLVNAGGIFALNTSRTTSSFEGPWVDAPGSTYGGGHQVLRSVVSGTVTGTFVPVPAAIWLFGSGLIGLIGLARRKA